MTEDELPVELHSKILDQEYLDLILRPVFLAIDDLIIVGAHYQPDNFKMWKEQMLRKNSPEDYSKHENTLNHVHLVDIVEDFDLQKALGELLVENWLKKLSVEFPEKRFQCQIVFGNDGWELQLWTKRL